MVIRLSAMGDVAITVPVLLALTRKYTHLKLTVLSKKAYAAIFDDLQGIDFYAADVKGKHKGLRGLYRLFTELKKLDFEAVADLHGVIRSNVLGGFFKTKGVLVAKIDKGRKEKKALTRPGTKVLRPLKTSLQRYAEVFSRLGYPIDFDRTYFLPKKELTEQTGELFKSGLANIHMGIAPFAAHEGKQYPLEKMRTVIAALQKTGEYSIFLLGGGIKEKQILDKLAEDFDHVQNVTGRFSLAEELAIISNLDVMLAMDSGNGHLAAMYGVPVITLWGVTHPCLGFVPYAQPIENQLTADRVQFPMIPTSVYGNKLPQNYDKAIATIDPQTIISRVREIVGDK